MRECAVMRVVSKVFLGVAVASVVGFSLFNRSVSVEHRHSPGDSPPASPSARVDQPASSPGQAGTPISDPAEHSVSQADLDILPVVGSLLHVAINERACLAGTASAAKPAKTAIHRWIDDKGITHFSDQAPGGAAQDYRKIDVQGLPPIVVNARGYDVNLPDDLVQNAISAAQAIERVLRGTLGLEGDPGLLLDIEFIAATDVWAQRIGNPAMVGSAGTYSPQSRTIHIRLQDDAPSNFLILRHEITHALMHERVGRLPTAINEGMAGYFEHLTVSGMGALITIADSPRSLDAARIDGDGQAELVDLLAYEGADFYAGNQQQRYLRAYALVAMLMEHAPGRAALSAVLAAQRAQPCLPVKAEMILDARYPGGLIALARDWVAWLGNPPHSVRSW